MNEKDIFKSTEGVLYNYTTLRAEISNLELEIEELKDEYQGVSGISYEERTGSTNLINDTVFNEVSKKQNELSQLERIKRSKQRLYKKIDTAIECLTEEEKKFVEYRYLNNMKLSWDQIGALLNLAPAYCCGPVRNEVVNKLSNLIFIGQNKKNKKP